SWWGRSRGWRRRWFREWAWWSSRYDWSIRAVRQGRAGRGKGQRSAVCQASSRTSRNPRVVSPRGRESGKCVGGFLPSTRTSNSHTVKMGSILSGGTRQRDVPICAYERNRIGSAKPNEKKRKERRYRSL